MGRVYDRGQLGKAWLRKRPLNRCQNGVKKCATQASGERIFQENRRGSILHVFENQLGGHCGWREVKREKAMGSLGSILESNHVKAWGPQRGTWIVFTDLWEAAGSFPGGNIVI